MLQEEHQGIVLHKKTQILSWTFLFDSLVYSAKHCVLNTSNPMATKALDNLYIHKNSSQWSRNKGDTMNIVIYISQ